MQNYMKHKKDQEEACSQSLKSRRAVTGQEAIDKIKESAKKMIEHSKRKRDEEQDKLLLESERKAQKRMQESEMLHDDIPPPHSSIAQVITPKKNVETVIQTEGISITLHKPAAVIEIPTERRSYDSTDDRSSQVSAGTAKGRAWDDSMKMGFLLAWIENAEQPFYIWLKGSKGNKKLAMDTIGNLIR